MKFVDAFSISSWLFLFLFFFMFFCTLLQCIILVPVCISFVRSYACFAQSKTRNENFYYLTKLKTKTNRNETKLTETVHIHIQTQTQTQTITMMKKKTTTEKNYLNAFVIGFSSRFYYFCLMFENLFYFTSIKRRTYNWCFLFGPFAWILVCKALNIWIIRYVWNGNEKFFFLSTIKSIKNTMIWMQKKWFKMKKNLLAFGLSSRNGMSKLMENRLTLYIHTESASAFDVIQQRTARIYRYAHRDRACIQTTCSFFPFLLSCAKWFYVSCFRFRVWVYAIPYELVCLKSVR